MRDNFNLYPWWSANWKRAIPFFPMRNFFHVEQHHKWSGILLQTKDFTRSCVLFSVTCFCLKFVLIIASILTACVSKLRESFSIYTMFVVWSTYSRRINYFCQSLLLPENTSLLSWEIKEFGSTPYCHTCIFVWYSIFVSSSLTLPSGVSCPVI